MFFKKKKKEEIKEVDQIKEEVPTMNTLGDGIGAIPDFGDDIMPVGDTINSSNQISEDEINSLNELMPDNSSNSFNELKEEPIKLEVPITDNTENVAPVPVEEEADIYGEEIVNVLEPKTIDELKKEVQSVEEKREEQENTNSEEVKVEVDSIVESDNILENKEEKSIKDMSIDDIFMDVVKEEVKEKFCPNCGSKLDKDATECFLCGIKL